MGEDMGGGVITNNREEVMDMAVKMKGGEILEEGGVNINRYGCIVLKTSLYDKCDHVCLCDMLYTYAYVYTFICICVYFYTQTHF
jgi:hypothetical protein